MKSSTKANPLSSFFMVIAGPWGSRKTTTVVRMFADLPPRVYTIDGQEKLFPQKLWVFNADMKLNGPLEQTKKSYPNLDVLYADPYHKDDGTPVPLDDRYAHFIESTNEAIKSPEVGAMFYDSASSITDILKHQVFENYSKLNPKCKFFDQQCWGILGDTYTKIFAKLKACGKPIIFSVHEDLVMDALNQAQPKVVIAIPGATKTKIGTIATDVVRSELKEANKGYDHMIRVSPTPVYDLTNSLGLEGQLPVDDFIKAWKKKYLG